MDDLDHELLRLNRSNYVLANGLDLYTVAELLGNVIADVGVKQRPADVLYGLRYIDFGNFAFALKYLE